MKLEISPFDQIQADVDSLVSPALSVSITAPKDADQALTLARSIKGLDKLVEARRTELVKPLNDEVKHINSLAKKILLPLDKAEAHLKKELIKWDNHLEGLRIEEKRKALEAYEKEQAEIKAKSEELKMDQLFGDQNLFKEEAALDEAALNARLNFNSDSRAAEAIKVSGTSTFWDFEVLDTVKVPTEYRVISDSLIRDAVRAGVRTIDGVRIFQNKRMAIR